MSHSGIEAAAASAPLSASASAIAVTAKGVPESDLTPTESGYDAAIVHFESLVLRRGAARADGSENQGVRGIRIYGIRIQCSLRGT